jgi:hypothetical protein
MLLFHYNDPARAGRILNIENGDRRIVAETPETTAAFKEFVLGRSGCNLKEGAQLGPAIKIRLPWAAA